MEEGGQGGRRDQGAQGQSLNPRSRPLGQEATQIKVTYLPPVLPIQGLWVTFLETHREWLAWAALPGNRVRVGHCRDGNDQFHGLQDPG